MKRNRITNISTVKLEFFVKVEGDEDKLVSLDPGATCFSDGEELTRSIKIFQRKNLLQVETGEFPVVQGFSDFVAVKIYSTDPNPNSDEDLDNLHTTKDVRIEIGNTPEQLKSDLQRYHNISDNEIKDMMKEISLNEIKLDLFKEPLGEETPTISADWAIDSSTLSSGNLLEQAEQQAKEYKEDSEGKNKKQYKYNYKKKPGRKKKRGPKPGSKKKKNNKDGYLGDQSNNSDNKE